MYLGGYRKSKTAKQKEISHRVLSAAETLNDHFNSCSPEKPFFPCLTGKRTLQHQGFLHVSRVPILHTGPVAGARRRARGGAGALGPLCTAVLTRASEGSPGHAPCGLQPCTAGDRGPGWAGCLQAETTNWPSTGMHPQARR